MASKIALCFLTYSNFSRPDAWKEYDDDERFNIYIHNKFPVTDYLSKRCISGIVDTEWGDISLVKATLSLFHAALEDPNNASFILLCGSSVPLFSPKELYSYIMSKNTNILYQSPNDSFVENDMSTSAGRFNTLADKTFFPRSSFIKQDQWMVLNRETASFFITNNFLQIFGSKFFIPDEHYFINIMRKFRIPFLNEPIMYVEWKEVVGRDGYYLIPVTHAHLSDDTIEKAKHKGCFFVRKIAQN